MATNLFQTYPTKVITGVRRLTYAFIWEAQEQDDGSKKFTTSFLIPKSDVKTLTKIQNAVGNAVIHGRAKGFWTDKLPPNFKLPLRDGDEEADEKGEEYRGNYFINATSMNRPGVIDTQKEEILDPEEVYSGCYGRLSVNFYPFNTKGNKGIACGLNHVQKIADGEPLSAGRRKAADDFAEDGDDSGDLPFPGEPGYDGPEAPPASYAPPQPPVGAPPPQMPNGYPGMQPPPMGYPPPQAQAGYPGMQQFPGGYPYPPQQQPGYPPQQAGYPINPAATFNDQVAAAGSILPPDLFSGGQKKDVA